jgi:hypothetical protein
MILKSCKYCTENFKTAYSTIRFCSFKCKKLYTIKENTLVCFVCDNFFVVDGNRRLTAKFCSKICEMKSRERRVLLICQYCHKQYYKIQSKVFFSKYCSDKCTRQSRNQGKATEAAKFYHSKAWHVVRTQAFERDNHTCQKCGITEGNLEGNHIRPRSRFPELALVIENIETLCKFCHIEVTTQQKRKKLIH